MSVDIAHYLMAVAKMRIVQISLPTDLCWYFAQVLRPDRLTLTVGFIR